jgi:hypothetical protein
MPKCHDCKDDTEHEEDTTQMTPHQAGAQIIALSDATNEWMDRMSVEEPNEDEEIETQQIGAHANIMKKWRHHRPMYHHDYKSTI